MRKICLLLALGIILSVSGCSKGQAAKETTKEEEAEETKEEEAETVKRRLEIYSAEDSNTILATIEDQEIVNKLMDDSGWTDVEKAPEGLEPEFEIIETITTFKDSDYIEKVYSQNAVKNIMIPISSVGYYYTVPEEFFEFLQDALK